MGFFFRSAPFQSSQLWVQTVITLLFFLYCSVLVEIYDISFYYFIVFFIELYCILLYCIRFYLTHADF